MATFTNQSYTLNRKELFSKVWELSHDGAQSDDFRGSFRVGLTGIIDFFYANYSSRLTRTTQKLTWVKPASLTSQAYSTLIDQKLKPMM